MDADRFRIPPAAGALFGVVPRAPDILRFGVVVALSPLLAADALRRAAGSGNASSSLGGFGVCIVRCGV